MYDVRINALYCKRVDQTDLYIGEQTLKKGKGLSRITFDKVANRLEVGTHDFVQKFSNGFTNRINFDTKETLLTNFMRCRQHPKRLFAYKSKYKTRREIFAHVTNEQAPYFVQNGETIYTFHELGAAYTTFKKEVLDDTKSSLISYESILADKLLRGRYIELLNVHLDALLRRKGMIYSKDYRRHYFRKPEDSDVRKVEFTTRKTEQQKGRDVVKYYTYGKDTFYRHVAVEFKHYFLEKELYLILSPKYLFTEDGKKVLDPKQVTKYTNFLTSREFNNAYCDWLNFWWSYLTRDGSELVVYEDPVYRDAPRPWSAALVNRHPRITFSPLVEYTVDFGIYLDTKERKKKPNQADNEQQTNLLF